VRGRIGGIAIAVIAHALPLAAQSMPPYVAVNPVLTSRSGLYFQPYVDPEPVWRMQLLLDYASAIEYNDQPDGLFILDSELLRLDATVTRNIGRSFVGASLSFNGAYGGFMDGALDWYHSVTGLRVGAREIRPRNEFAYRLELPGDSPIEREASSGFLGDLRLFAGQRHTRHWQSAVALTLPTTTGPTGYGRGAASVSGITTVRAPIDGRLSFEGSAGLGITPRHGDLELLQRTVFGAASGGLRYRFWGRQALFINLFYQSASYQRSGVRSLDQHELTLDYGFLLKAKSGPEWFLGMTEDLEPKGPAIDLSFRIGARW
jgi:hypothetical protein